MCSPLDLQWNFANCAAIFRLRGSTLSRLAHRRRARHENLATSHKSTTHSADSRDSDSSCLNHIVCPPSRECKQHFSGRPPHWAEKISWVSESGKHRVTPTLKTATTARGFRIPSTHAGFDWRKAGLTFCRSERFKLQLRRRFKWPQPKRSSRKSFSLFNYKRFATLHYGISSFRMGLEPPRVFVQRHQYTREHFFYIFNHFLTQFRSLFLLFIRMEVNAGVILIARLNMRLTDKHTIDWMTSNKKLIHNLGTWYQCRWLIMITMIWSE